MTNSSFAANRSESMVQHGHWSRWLVCILAVLVLGLGRPSFDMPLSLISERDNDPVEQENAESAEELAIHCRCVFRRVMDQELSVTPRLVFETVVGTTCPLGQVSPHDFDLRNGLGAALRC